MELKVKADRPYNLFPPIIPAQTVAAVNRYNKDNPDTPNTQDWSWENSSIYTIIIIITIIVIDRSSLLSVMSAGRKSREGQRLSGEHRT